MVHGSPWIRPGSQKVCDMRMDPILMLFDHLEWFK
jgi:hypothetical protein